MKTYNFGMLQIHVIPSVDGQCPTILAVELGNYGKYFRIPGPNKRNEMLETFKWNCRRYLDPRPCYMEIHSMDCDLYHTYRAEKFSTYYLAMKAWDKEQDNAEGPIHYFEISKKEFKNYKKRNWDQAAEMMGF